MSMGIGSVFRKYFLDKILPIFSRKKEYIKELSVLDIVKKEVDVLWDMIKKMQEDKQSISTAEFEKKLVESFSCLQERFSEEELEKTYAWIRYINVAIQCENPPVEYLINYISKDNYIFLADRLYNLTKSVHKADNIVVTKNIDKLNETVWHHILDNVNSKDIPSCLSLGKAAQKSGNYAEARKWFTKVIETDEPFNGITSILACYEAETKKAIADIKKNRRTKNISFEKVHELNTQQTAIYEKWCGIMEDHINSGEDITEQYKREYVALISGYARFSRNIGDYKASFELLQRVPDTFPDFYRIYTEEAMLYQYKTYRNSYFDIDKAIETYKKAYENLCKQKGPKGKYNKSKKSILIPLANSYIQTGRYEEAKEACNTVLKIDKKEKSAIKLKNKIDAIKV